ncbi:MAG: hypothetical protein ACKOPT_14415 [Cyanobium sp.]
MVATYPMPPFGYFSRPLLLKTIKSRFDSGENVALFSRRRSGKTTFVQHELIPEAEEHWHWKPIYVSLWEDRARPMEVITRAIEQAAGIEPIQRLERELEGGASGGLLGVSFSAAGRRTRIGVDKTSLERWKIAIGKLAEWRRDTLLVIDEFQTLHLSDPDSVATAALRTTFEGNSHWLHILMTGSDRSAMTEIFRRQQSPLLGQASKVDLPPLDLAFDINRLKGLQKATTRSPLPSLEEITSTRLRLANSPELLNKALSRWVTKEAEDMAQAASLVENEIGDSGYAEMFANLKDTDQQVLIVCAFERPIYQNIPTMSANLGRELKASTVQSAERRLAQRGLIGLTGQNGIREILDPGFALWLMRQAEGVEWQPTRPRGAPRKRQAEAGETFFSSLE